ncbi:MAG: DUF4157 domain-containing protein [Chloroflexaceae bacterium]|nr:DUF4157 domain-containing protein [Chloroflexaceae bacterium]
MMHSQQHKPDPARPPTAEVGTAQTARHTPAATPPALAARPLLFGLAPVGAAEHEADERAEQRRRLPEAAPRDAGWVNPPPLLGLASPNGTGLRIQRKALDAEVDDGVEANPAAGLIVDDDVTEALGPGQLHKSEFLNQLEREVCRTAEQALSGTIWSAAGCPWIAHWFGYYHNRSASQIERAIRKYAPEAANSTSAQALIPIICARVERSIRVWTDTGEVTGVPEGIALDLPASGLMGIVGGAVSSIASGVSSVVSGVASVGASIAGGIGSAVSSLGSLFFKRQAGAAEMSANPHAVQGQLGSGQALDGGLQARMGSAFGVNLGLVRVHTDAGAATLARQFNARAFTVGQHIAFGSGEYRPGTPIGDALIAHELAHVLQQSAVHPMGGSDTVALEEDANRSALDVVASLWGGLNDTHVHGLPRLRSGLGLQRCASSQTRQPTTASAVQVASTANWEHDVRAAKAITDVTQRRDALAALARGALSGTGIQLYVANTSSGGAVNPADYQVAPMLNFDIHLNSKTSSSTTGGSTRSLADNNGYFFSRGSNAYAIIGPEAIDERSLYFTRMYAEHELYHTQHHVGSSQSFADEELETWTQDFRNYFHLLPHRLPGAMQWAPLIGYYERASPGAQQRALQQLVDYYTHPPVPASEVPDIQRAYAGWVRRRLRDSGAKQVAQDIDAQLHLSSPRP